MILALAKAIASPLVSQSLAREVKDEITRVDSRLSAVEEHLQQTRDTIGEQAQRMKVTLTLQEEVREASMEHLMDQQHELS